MIYLDKDSLLSSISYAVSPFSYPVIFYYDFLSCMWSNSLLDEVWVENFDPIKLFLLIKLIFLLFFSN